MHPLYSLKVKIPGRKKGLIMIRTIITQSKYISNTKTDLGNNFGDISKIRFFDNGHILFYVRGHKNIFKNGFIHIL